MITSEGFWHTDEVITNPYTPRSLPALLAGRARELAIGDQVLVPVLSSGRAAEGAVVLFGVRGIGKTSTLREMAHRAQSQGMVTAWMSAARQQPLLSSMPLAIYTALESAEVISRGTWTFDQFRLEVGLPLFKVSATASRTSDTGESQWTVGSVERLLRETARLCHERGSGQGGGLLLLIDELHAVRRDELAVLLNALQNIAHDRLFSPPFAFFGAGLPSVRGVLTQAATFGERTEFVHISTLTDTAAREALAQPAADLSVTWDTDALAYVASQSRGFPFFVQLFGFTIWAAVNPVAGGHISLEQARQGVKAARSEVENLFVARIDAASSSEMDFMLALASVAGDQPAKRSDIAQKLGRSTHEISEVRSRLLDKAVITEERYGYVQFTLPGFAEFLLETVA